MRNSNFTFINDDVISGLDQIEDEVVQLTVSSPPYNMGRAYEQKTSLDEYAEPFSDWIKTLFTKTAEGGSVCWQVGNYVRKSEVLPLDYIFYPLFIEAGFTLRNRIVWHFEHGLHARTRFSGRYETILWFTKGADYVFNLDEIRIPSKYPGKRSYKGPNKGKISGNPNGKNPSDFWPDVVLNDWETGIWNVPNVKANHPEKTAHPCQFPVELVQRCVLALSMPGDTVFDPFMGVGSTAIAALTHNRKFLGFEIDPAYYAEAKTRVSRWERGDLKVRPLGKPIFKPSGREKVARRPDEWSEQ